jgi:hypothetical protein
MKFKRGMEILHNEELCDSYRSPGIAEVIKRREKI